MLSLRLFRPGVPQGREEKAFLSIKWRIHLIDGAVQQPRFINNLHGILHGFLHGFPAFTADSP